MSENVKIKDLIKGINLELLTNTEDVNRLICTSDISRPGLELTGYFNYYPKDRIQLLGQKEISFANKMSSDERRIVFRRMCTEETPAFIISRNLSVPDELVAIGNERGIPVLRSNLSTSHLSGVLTNYLESRLAERLSVHGVLVEVYGLGVLIQGDSGIGKSETGLELIKKGHRLIADDRVDVYQKDERTVIGEPPKILQHLIEIRGVGIIDVMNLFGASAVKGNSQIQLIVYLENWTGERHYDRLGGNEEKVQFFDVEVPKITIPVKTGRNVAIITEVAAMNFRAKTMGYDATKMFENKLTSLIAENSDEIE